jgi:hypothetical protein
VLRPGEDWPKLRWCVKGHMAQAYRFGPALDPGWWICLAHIAEAVRRKPDVK